VRYGGLSRVRATAACTLGPFPRRAVRARRGRRALVL